MSTVTSVISVEQRVSYSSFDRREVVGHVLSRPLETLRGVYTVVSGAFSLTEPYLHRHT